MCRCACQGHHRSRTAHGDHHGKLIALLDASAGVEYEGEAKPARSDADRITIKAWNMLTNGMGGIDYAGLPLVAAWLGIDDMDDLMTRLLTVKTHKKPEGES